MTVLTPAAVTTPSPRPTVSSTRLFALALDLVPVAIRRQLWVLFFDDHGEQLPMVVPIDIGPGPADESAVDGLMVSLGRICDEFGGASVAVVIERPGVAGPGRLDRDWAVLLRACGRRASVSLVGVLSSTDGGVHDVAVDVTPPGRLGEVGRGVDAEGRLLGLHE